MNTLQWIDAGSVEEAVVLLSAPGAKGVTFAKAGGLDLLDLMKEGIVAPARIVNLQRIDALRGVQFADATGLRLGALTTLAEIANDASIRRYYPALAAAAVHAATPQVRNAATIGGNLLQRPRCWYFRNALFHDSRAEAGREQSQYGAIFDNARSTMVHASTPATALLAYGAQVHVVGKQGNRTIALGDFLLPPDFDRDRDTTLGSDEVLTHLTVPPAAAQTTAAYHKQTERDSYDWPICDVAVVLTSKDRKVEAVKIVAGAVAPVPRRMTASENLLLGREIDEQLAAEAARLAVRDATPTAKNSYKVPVLEAVTRRTLMAAVR
jgi:xanthine dehydrogenase YagS FAD-binding subunit